VSLALDPMAGDAGALRSRRSAAQGDHLSGRREGVDRACLDRRRATGRGRRQRGETTEENGAHSVTGTALPPGRFPEHRAIAGQRGSLKARVLLVASALAAAACKPPPEPRIDMPLADVERGRQAIARAGCGSCHTIEGIDWPQGQAGPPLRDFGDRAPIAGHLPNRPDLLAPYIRNAPVLAPE